MKRIYLAVVCLAFYSCKSTSEQTPAPESIASFETLDSAFSSLVSSNATVDTLGEGYEWSEGPVWVDSLNMLLFSDVPKNTVYKWTEAKGVEVYLTPSGYTGSGQYSNEPGSNGLTLSPDGKLVLCQHGDRRVAILDAELTAPQAKFITLADNYNGKKLNSPNDVVFNQNGEMFFTDPPYGLPKQADDSTKETPHNGVYLVTGGKTILLVDSLTRPNGIALMPGGETLIVANSDPEKSTWYAFDIVGGQATNSRVFFDATPNAKAGEAGSPDGFRIDSSGNVFATGPGGIWVFDSGGKPLGRIRLKQLAANCELSPDEKTLFVTADMYLLRIKLRD